jgi:hypothetical protein
VLYANEILHSLFVRPVRRFEEGGQVIRERVARGSPCMIARFGAAEIKAVVYPMLPKPLRSAVSHRISERLRLNAGVFPSGEETLRRFAALMEQDTREVDILGSWRSEEALLLSRLRNVDFVPLATLEPYRSDAPWSVALKGLKVLVVHPFTRTIESQYRINRHRLFRDDRILPEFKSLTLLQAVQSIAGSPTRFEDWFQALDWMKDQITAIDFDVALIGCGAYGFPLTAHVKRLGRIGIHLGGATQLLFGIRGKRWDHDKELARHVNEYWVRPSAEETPPRARIVENGCYW